MEEARQAARASIAERNNGTRQIGGVNSTGSSSSSSSSSSSGSSSGSGSSESSSSENSSSSSGRVKKELSSGGNGQRGDYLTGDGGINFR